MSADDRLAAALIRAGQVHRQDERALAEYIAEAVRVRWTWRRTASALGITPRRAAAIWQRELVRRGLA